MGSASLAAARPAARTVTTIPLQPEGLRGKNVFLSKNVLNNECDPHKILFLF